MNQKQIYDILQKQAKVEPIGMHSIYSFIGGGCMAVFAQGLCSLYHDVFALEQSMSVSLTLVTIIVITAILTGIGVYDQIAQRLGAGVFIPISGFANALVSCAIESKSEGFIFGIGSHMFALAGSVLTYGVSASVLFNLLRYLIEVVL